MDKKWTPVVLALILGTVLPRVMLGAQVPVEQQQTEPPLTVQQTQLQTQPSEPTQATYLPVLMQEDYVQVMDLEKYILGVVLAEMWASFDEEALKAQSVVARTYALRRFYQGDKHEDCAICTDPNCCQAYISTEDYLQQRGTQQDVDKITKAVEQTKGQILTYQGKVVEATYFSCSGGRTEDALAVWGEEIPYLQAVDSPGEENAQAYCESVYFTAKKFARALGRDLAGTPKSWLGKVTYTAGGGVDTMVVGGITYTGTKLRKLLGLNSTAFTMTADSDGIAVETLGKGHRVGMSQYGADAMARSGSSYEEILAYYYQGTRIDKIGNIG